MEKFTVLNGLVAPLDRANVDTDQIIPKEYLKSIKRTGYAEGLFAAWRHDPQFVLNRPQYKGASILLARKNFGCGSSREHAPWALQQYGFKCVIAPSYGDIFFNNSFKNGFLPVVLREDEVDKLFYEAASFPGSPRNHPSRGVLSNHTGCNKAHLAGKVQVFRASEDLLHA